MRIIRYWLRRLKFWIALRSYGLDDWEQRQIRDASEMMRERNGYRD